MTSNPLERAFEWSRDKIRWYCDACEYRLNDRNAKIADAILRHLRDEPRLCDVGCGVGYLSVELAKRAKCVLSLELNPDALAELEKTVAARGITNITPLVGDFDSLEPQGAPYDGMALCMFGGMLEYVAVAERWLAHGGKTFFITTVAKKRTFSSSGAASPHMGLDDMREYLNRGGFEYSECVIPTAFGQPFKDFEDARRFMRAYDKLSGDKEIDDDLRNRLVETGESEFSLYLPAEKEYLLFIIDRRV